MKPWTFALLLGALATTPSSFAQTNTHLFENFESGLPAGWQASSSTAAGWHVAAPGECGSVTNMLAFNAGPAACNFGSGAGPQSALLELPLLYAPSGFPPWKLAFDYILDVDASGDAVTFFVVNTSGIALGYATSSSLLNDGALHSVSLDVPTQYATPVGSNVQLYISFDSDGVGDQGRGFLIDNVRFTTTNPAAVTCNGQAPSSCPCGNGSGTLAGCANSTGAGAGLSASGISSLSADTLQLQATHVPPSSPTLFFEGTTQVGSVFGNGRLCAGGTTVRLGTRASPSGAVVLPGPGQPPISSTHTITLGANRIYQAMYRDAAGPCGQAFNLTNGLSQSWIP